MLEPRRYTEWLHEKVFLPTIVVIGTETAKLRCKEANRLSLAELFSPFGGTYRKIQASYQSLEKHINVDSVRVRFADADSSSQWSSAQAEKVAQSAVEAASPKNPNDPFMQAPPEPWFDQWRMVMFHSLRWSEHEGLDQPVTALLVVSSKESDPVFLFEQLLHSSNMPPLCTQGVLDPVPARAAVLLHDHADPDSPSLAELEAKLDLVRARFSPHLCLAVQINRGNTADPALQELFKPFLVRSTPPPPPPPDGSSSDAALCQHLCREDLDALSHMASEIIIKSSLPWMCGQLQQLENQISQTRKGFKNQLKYLWRKPKEQKDQEEQKDQGGVYPLQTTEGQMRLAGDLAFHLHDYEAALGYYRTVVSDYKQDKSWKHAAGAYEMWGLCGYISGGGSRTEAERCMENAYEHYLKAAAGRHAMRAVILHLAMVCDYKEAAARLMKVNGDMSDTGLRSALILEQAAQLYGFAGSTRKSSFHMVLAGHTFNKLGFKRLALHCYSIVAGRYKHKRWFHITDHFHFTMARQAFGLNFLQESMEHFVELLNSFTVNDKRTSIQADRESTYLKEFLFVVRNWIERCNPAEADRVVELQIPVISPDITVLFPADLRHGASSVPLAADEKPSSPLVPWENLGEKMVKVLGGSDRLELQWRNHHDDKVFDVLQRSTAVGSEVCVEMALSNPMRVELKLTNFRLSGELVDGPAVSDQESVEFPSQAITLGPSESKRVQLTASPKCEGLLKIQKVSWSLNDQVQCCRALQMKGRRLHKTVEQRASKQGVYSEDKRLEVKVRAHVPQIRAHLEGWPNASEEPLLLGEVRKCTLVVEETQQGPSSAKSLRMCCSHPAFMVCSAPESGAAATSHEGGVLVHTGGVDSILRFPVTLRADAVGRHIIRVCILAEAAPDADVPKSDMRQWITLQEQLTVAQSLSCTVSPSASLQDTSRFIFSLAMENKSVNSLEIRRVYCIAGEKELPFEETVKHASKQHQVGPNQLMNLLFAIDRGAQAVEKPTLSRERMVLLKESRDANPDTSKPGATASQRWEKKDDSLPEDRVDVVVEWATGGGSIGDVYSLRVPFENPPSAAHPCPLALHLLAPESATFAPDLLVPVTLCVRNISNKADTSFYFEAMSTPDIVWLGCEKSEVIKLAPQASHTAQLHAFFCSPGVFDLNHFRLHVVSSTATSTEKSTTAYTLRVERLIHIKADSEGN